VQKNLEEYFSYRLNLKPTALKYLSTFRLVYNETKEHERIALDSKAFKTGEQIPPVWSPKTEVG